MRPIIFTAGFLLAALPAVQTAGAASQEVAAAETTVRLDLGFMHTQYHENISPVGDVESGLTPGFGVGASALLPIRPGWNPDLYTALDYDFNAGNIHYGGHYQPSLKPASATDNTVFNRLEAKIGLGYQLPGTSLEFIPFIAAGYQAWNRNINQKDEIGSDEFYHSGLVGGGIKLDAAVTPKLVASFTGEFLALVGGGIAIHSFGINQSFGHTGEQRATFTLDDAASGRIHIFGTMFWEHFNYSGSKPSIGQMGDLLYLVHEPLSTTTQFGASIGVAYSFY